MATYGTTYGTTDRGRPVITSMAIWSIGALFLLLIGSCMTIMPRYNVYQQRLEGQAILAHSQAARMVLVNQAEAELESASKRAEAIKIVGQAAKDFPQYRQQEFIGAFAEALQGGKISQIIYVPTEANIPIIEAGRIAQQQEVKK